MKQLIEDYKMMLASTEAEIPGADYNETAILEERSARYRQFISDLETLSGVTDNLPTKFFKMQSFPHPVEGETFSETVLVFDEKDNAFAELGFYDFESKEWAILRDMSMRLVCWCYLPHPKEFLSKQSFISVIHRGYRP
jgi:hypothetical protein